MKIFIVGDSFCANNTEKSWTKKLEKNIKNSSIKVIGEQGASLFFAYQNLLKNLNYDYYIILITNPGRLFFEESPHFSNPFSAHNKLIKLNDDTELKNKCRATIDYYKYLRSDIFDNFVHQQLLNEIKNTLKNKNKILFPCFKSSGVNAPFTMFEILEKGFKPFSQKYKYYHEVYRYYQETENIINHHSKENQEILGNYFTDVILKGTSNITIQHFKECDQPFEFYYEKVK